MTCFFTLNLYWIDFPNFFKNCWLRERLAEEIKRIISSLHIFENKWFFWISYAILLYPILGWELLLSYIVKILWNLYLVESCCHFISYKHSWTYIWLRVVAIILYKHSRTYIWLRVVAMLYCINTPEPTFCWELLLCYII